MNLWNRLGASLVAIVLTVAAFGQGATTPPATCTTPPAGVTALQIERAVPLTNALTTLTPNIPAPALAALAGGALEIRELDVYNPQLGIFTITLFVVPAGSPLPSPLSVITAANTVAMGTVKNGQIVTSCSPTPSLMFVGTVASANPNPFGANPMGAPAAFSLGYTLDSPPKIHDVIGTFAGLLSTYTASATGTLTFPPAPSGGGTTPGTGPTIVVNTGPGTTSIPANSHVQAPSSPFFLDASKSTGNGALTFVWTTTSNSPVAFVGTGVPGQIFVQFPTAGDYAILLTVTDSTGAKATFPLTLTFVGRPQ